MAADNYIPGVCNIGLAEIRRRKLIGWVALTTTLIAWIALAAWGVSPTWRLLTFFPAAVAAIGFLQAAWHFCARFGLGGVFNFGPNVGRTDTVQQAEYRQKDRQTALTIVGLSIVIGAVVAAAAYFVPR